MKKQNKFCKLLLIPAILGAFSLTSCNEQSTIADTVVYSKIYTANNQEYAEAFAVKDGKYIYVGSKNEAKKYVKQGTTQVLDYSDGFVMPGATEGHGHYIMISTLTALDLIRTTPTIEDLLDFAKEVVEKNPSSTLYLTYGWDNVQLGNIKSTINIRKELDKICSDKPMVLIDNTGHNVFMNSKTIEQAGLTSETNVEGGSFSKDSDGNLLGLASDVAMNYVMSKVVKPANFISASNFEKAIEIGQNKLHADGYTYYLDALTSYFGESAYIGISEYDKNIGLEICMEATYKIDPFEEDLEGCIKETVSYKEKYTTSRFNPDCIKLFGDGECVESMSGWVIEPYKDGTYGTQVWKDEQMNYLVKTANENGISVHAHTSGDAASRQVVNAMVNAKSTAKDGVKNSIAHCFGLTNDTMDLMAEYNIGSATNIGWRNYVKSYNGFDGVEDIESKFSSFDWYIHGYPLKSQLNRGIVLASSTDYPSNSFGPTDILNIIELAVNGTMDRATSSYPEGAEIEHFDSSEFITFNQALDVMTINGAKLLGIDKERGSIETGKYADFLYLDKDISSIPVDAIHTANISDVYFEGKLSYTKQ
jgi:predicted amidohydrolase YtcJ